MEPNLSKPGSVHDLSFLSMGVSSMAYEVSKMTVIKTPCGIDESLHQLAVERAIYERLGSHPYITKVLSIQKSYARPRRNPPTSLSTIPLRPPLLQKRRHALSCILTSRMQCHYPPRPLNGLLIPISSLFPARQSHPRPKRPFPQRLRLRRCLLCQLTHHFSHPLLKRLLRIPTTASTALPI